MNTRTFRPGAPGWAAEVRIRVEMSIDEAALAADALDIVSPDSSDDRDIAWAMADAFRAAAEDADEGIIGEGRT